jgi:hypothetical protein
VDDAQRRGPAVVPAAGAPGPGVGGQLLPRGGDVLGLGTLALDRGDDVVAGEAEGARGAGEIVDVEVGDRAGDDGAD